MSISLIFIALILSLSACTEKKQQQPATVETKTPDSIEQKRDIVDTIVDCNFTFAEAIAGTRAPKSVIDQLELLDVVYISTDLKPHKGQILCHRQISDDIRSMFAYMLKQEFVVEKAIPIVAYNWNDSLSMANNNTYSFCYRNVSYSKHAKGMAIDINPRFNPLRWKKEKRPNQPKGAILDTTVNGTLYPEHAIVKEFKRRGFKWGHVFSKYYDDHHFEKVTKRQ